jgi:DNA-binding transcriptional regulator YiaG
MPVLYKPSHLRLKRLRQGVPLLVMSKALGHSVSTLSLLERRYISKPQIEKKMLRFLRAHEAQ